MDQSTHHRMELAETFETGAQEWICRDCDRRFVMVMEPEFVQIVLQKGEERSIHSGATGGLRLSSSMDIDERDEHLSEDLRNALDDFLNGLDPDDES